MISNSVERINRLISSKTQDESLNGLPIMVHICGVSASGKSTVSDLLATNLPFCSIFPMDSYLSERLWDESQAFNHNSPDPSRPYIGGISPEIYDMSLMRAHLRAVRLGGAIDMPVFDKTIKDRVGYKIFVPTRVILVEGIYSFQDEFMENCSYAVLIRASLHDRLTRKVVRTFVKYHRQDVDEVISRYLIKDEPINRIYEPEHIAVSDEVINNPADPIRDYANLPHLESAFDNGRRFLLTPRDGFGKSHIAEDFNVIILGDGNSYVQYRVEERILVEAPIKSSTVDLLENYYDLS